MNSTYGTLFEANTFEEAFVWGVSQLPGPKISLNEMPAFKAEFEDRGRTAFDDLQDRCYAETIEIWDTDKFGVDFPEEEDD